MTPHGSLEGQIVEKPLQKHSWPNVRAVFKASCQVHCQFTGQLISVSREVLRGRTLPALRPKGRERPVCPWVAGVLPSVQRGPARKDVISCRLVLWQFCPVTLAPYMVSHAWVFTCWGSRNVIGVHLRTHSVLLPIISCQLKLNLFIAHQLKKFRFQKQKPQGNNVTLIRAISIHNTGF